MRQLLRDKWVRVKGGVDAELRALRGILARVRAARERAGPEAGGQDGRLRAVERDCRDAVEDAKALQVAA